MAPRVFVLLLLMGCARREKSPAESPRVVTVEGALHAISCGGVTAVFSGSAAQLRADAPRSYAIESLAFRFADGAQVGFAPTGQLFFSDWGFDIFSPDCALVALQVDHYGPIHVVKTGELRSYLAGTSKPLEVTAPAMGSAAPVLGQFLWVSRDAFDFVASANGGAEVLRAQVVGTFEVKNLLSAPHAPSGVRRTATGYELVR